MSGNVVNIRLIPIKERDSHLSIYKNVFFHNAQRLPIEHPVDDDAGDRDIEPNREGPSGDCFVFFEASLQGAGGRHQGERDNQGGQKGMGDKKGKIDGANPAALLERDGTDEIMVGEIRGEKEGGNKESSSHEEAVALHPLAANGPPAQEEQKRRQTV